MKYDLIAEAYVSMLQENSNSNENLTKQFLDKVSPNMMKFYSKRDNCGPACLDMMSMFPHLKRIRGYFRADSVVHDKNDFTPEMKKEFHKTGMDFNNPLHRKQFIETSPKYAEEWKKIPHFWLKDADGNIHDPVGDLQFIKTGFSTDLNKNRYIEDPLA